MQVQRLSFNAYVIRNSTFSDQVAKQLLHYLLYYLLKLLYCLLYYLLEQRLYQFATPLLSFTLCYSLNLDAAN